MGVYKTCFFISKKCELSSKLWDGKFSKKPRDESLGDSIVADNIDIYTKGLNSPESHCILSNCLGISKKKMKVFRSIAETAQQLNERH